MARLKKTRIMVPVIMEAAGEEKNDWDGMTAYGRALRARAEQSLNLGVRRSCRASIICLLRTAGYLRVGFV